MDTREVPETSKELRIMDWRGGGKRQRVERRKSGTPGDGPIKKVRNYLIPV